jgi:hypothetical protein
MIQGTVIGSASSLISCYYIPPVTAIVPEAQEYGMMPDYNNAVNINTPITTTGIPTETLTKIIS